MADAILLFGRLKDAFGAASLALPPGVATVADLRRRLAELHPELAQTLMARSVRIALNQKLIVDEARATISPGDEIALLPPLSGG